MQYESAKERKRRLHTAPIYRNRPFATSRRPDAVVQLRQDTCMSRRLKILLTWELGGALGHLGRLRPLALRLAELGHSVVLALRHSPHNAALPAVLRILPVPGSRPVREPIAQPVSIADVLHNEGAADAAHLAARVRAWRGLFDTLRPDAVVMDYSPIALLALQGLKPARISLGTGFASPPAVSPLPNLRAWQDHYPDRIQATENALLRVLNRQLAGQNQPALHCVGELFERVDANLLTTFAELDHYPQRSSGEYVGTWSDLAGLAPEWPSGEGARAFAYLKPFRGLTRLLDHLAARSVPSLIHIGGDIPTGRWQGASLHFAERPVNIKAAAQSCDLAILHAGHGSTAAMLLAGTPILQLPVHIEQYHNALATVRMGAGRMAMLDRPEEIETSLQAMLATGEGREGARRFAAQHAAHDPDQVLSGVAERIILLAHRD